MPDKPFKTHDELLTLLISRGVDISSSDEKSFAKKKLQRIGYYNLINGYSDLFYDRSQGVDVYKQGTTISEIAYLYHFDEKLRQIFFKYILPIETNIKSLVAYVFPQYHPETNYLVYTNFNTVVRNANRLIPDLLAELQKQIAGRTSDPSISHYLEKYGYIPLWVLNNILTLGTLSKFYSLMKQKERQDIAKTFHLSDTELESCLLYISAIRNFCAHNNRLYCYRSKRVLCNTIHHQNMGLPLSASNEYLYGKRDLFAVMIVFKMLLSRNDLKKLIKEVDINLKNLYKHTNVLSQNDILNSMGFPSDWKKLLLKK